MEFLEVMYHAVFFAEEKSHEELLLLCYQKTQIYIVLSSHLRVYQYILAGLEV